MLFVWIVLLDTVLIYFQDYTPYERFANLSSLRLGAEPAPVFWVVIVAQGVSYLLFARLLIASLPAPARKRRWVTGIIGAPLLFLGTGSFDYGFARLLEGLAGAPGLERAIPLFIITGALSLVSIALFLALARSEGSGRMIASLVPLFIRVFPLALLLGPIVYLVRNLSFIFLMLPLIGPVLEAAFNLWLALWFLRTLALMVKADLLLSAPVRAPSVVAIFSGFLTLVLVSLAVVFVPGPRHNLDAEPVPPLILHNFKVSPSQYDDRGGKVIVSSKLLEVIIGKDPFDIAVLDRSQRVLLSLCTDPDKGADYRGVALNRELRALRAFPLLGPGTLFGSRLRLRSLVMDKADDIRMASGEVMAEHRVDGRPLVVTFSFYDEDILKITVDAGSRSSLYSTSIAFSSSASERFMGLGSGWEGLDRRGTDLDLMTGGGTRLIPQSVSEFFSRATAGRWRLSSGEGPSWPVPFVLVSRGAGIFFAETVDPRIELGTRYPDALRFSGRGGPINLYIIAGATPLDIIRKFGRLTGQRASLPPGTLLPWIEAEAAAKSDASGLSDKMAALRREGISAEYVHLMADSSGGDVSLEGWEDALARGRARGFRFMADDRAEIGPGDEGYEEAAQKGYLVMNRMGLPYLFLTRAGARALIDFMNPAAVKWRGATWQRLAAAGADAVLLGDDCLVPPDSVLYNGDPGLVLRNVYPLLYAKAVSEILGPDRAVFSKRGFAGMERFVPLAWPERLTDGNGGDDLERALAGMLNLSVSAIPAGGPGRADPGPAASFSSQVRAMGPASASPLFILPEAVIPHNKTGASGDLQKEARNLAEMHVRLLPCLYSLVTMQEQDGYPIIQSPALANPGDADAYKAKDQYLLGSGLLVAAASRPGQARQSVYFPPGRWVSLESLAVYRQGVADVPRDSERPLLFLGEGRLLPLYATPFQTLEPVKIKSIPAGALDDEITMMWVSGEPAALALFDGTRVSVRRVGDSIMVKSAGKVKRDFVWRILDCDPALAVFINQIKAAEAQIEYQPRARILTISDVPGPAYDMEVVVKQPG
jgi:alpha-D-xyloside xylohydrolase